jgi:hypothetical protein
MKSNELEIEVTLNIFSGRPNPKWLLSEKQIKTLSAKLGEFTVAEPESPLGLGYRGVTITNLSKSPRLPERILAYNGILSICNNRTTIHQEDINNIEGWLLAQGDEQGYGEAIKHFK